MGDSTQKAEVAMKTKVIMSFTVRPDLRVKLKRAAREDAHKISPLIESLIENYLEVRNASKLENPGYEPDPLGLRA